VEHRRFLAYREPHRPFAGDLFARIGGQAAIDSLIAGLYDRIETDTELRPLFGRDLTNERDAQKRFFSEWLGGDREYSDRAYLPMKHRHELLPITRELANKWLAHFRAALSVAVSDVAARAAIDAQTTLFARALVNEGTPRSAMRARSHGTCLRYEPAIDALRLARGGDAVALKSVLEHAPEILASVPHAASLMHLAVLGGRRAVVELLLDHDVDVDKPSPIEPMIFVTPLCAARAKRRTEIEAVLIRHGAREDIFTHAFMGDLARVREDLERESAQVIDPAVDALEVTPVHHAIVGGHLEALRMLLAEEPVLGGGRAIRDAVMKADVAMVALLLEHGVAATTIGAGRWVLHPELAPILARAGACVDRTGSWIGLACTGNQGRKDDPTYVAALLRHGARVDDKRLAGQGADGGHATALHYAAKAGFTKTIAVLLEHGANRSAVDDNGQTPLDWIDRAATSVDRAAVRAALRG
jgi:truncated hemoglobin YjbI/ankyrin repeat protein